MLLDEIARVTGDDRDTVAGLPGVPGALLLDLDALKDFSRGALPPPGLSPHNPPSGTDSIGLGENYYGIACDTMVSRCPAVP